MASKSSVSLTVSIAWLVVAITIVIGWCMNIYQITQMYDNGITAKFVFKVIGVFVFPLGGLLGILN